MKHLRYNDSCIGCQAPGPVCNLPEALPTHDRKGFIQRFYAKVNWLMSEGGPLCPTCKVQVN